MSRAIIQSNVIHPKLQEAKQKGVRLIASDIDWTLRDPHDPRFNFVSIQKLCCRIKQKGIEVLILTGRDASLQRDLVPGLIKSLKDHRITSPIFAGCANGINLYAISQSGLRVLYQNNLNRDQTVECLEVCDKTIKKYHLKLRDFQTHALQVFQGFLSSDWDNIIPNVYIKKASPYRGILFIEPSKLSVALPKDSSKKIDLINTLRKNLSDHYSLKGDQEFTHITKAVSDDGTIVADKSYALAYVLKMSGISITHSVVFGGALDEIDRTMLQSCRYSFTNQIEYVPTDPNAPPFKLHGSTSPVKNVHNAINYLIL